MAGRRPVRAQMCSGFCGAVVEGLERRGVDDLAVHEIGAEARSDHPLARDPVDDLGGGAHEVAVAAGDDEGQEAVGLEVAQQLDHRREGELRVRTVERRVPGLGEEGRDLLGVGLDADPRRPLRERGR
jgi:hypothetical protein